MTWQEFLLLDELNQLETDLKPWAQTLLEAPVTANNVSATWNKVHNASAFTVFILHNIALHSLYCH